MGVLYLPVLFQLLSSEVWLIVFGYLIRLLDLLNHFLMKIGLTNYFKIQFQTAIIFLSPEDRKKTLITFL